MTEHQHVQVFSQGILCVRSCWVCRRWQCKMFSCNLHYVWRMTSPSSLCVICVQRPAVYRINRVFHVRTFVNRVRMYCQLRICSVTGSKRCIKNSRCSTPVFMIFQAACPCIYLFHLGSEIWMRIISFPQESPIYWNIFYSFEHSAHIIYTRCASCSGCSISRSCSSADHVTDTVADSVHVLLRRDHVYVRIEVAQSTYGMFACGSFCTG